jgi:hypothetical protein
MIPEIADRPRNGWRIIPLAVLFLVGLYLALAGLLACGMLAFAVASSWANPVPDRNWFGIARLFVSYGMWLSAGCLLLVGLFYLERRRGRPLAILIATAIVALLVSRLVFQPIPI